MEGRIAAVQISARRAVRHGMTFMTGSKYHAVAMQTYSSVFQI